MVYDHIKKIALDIDFTARFEESAWAGLGFLLSGRFEESVWVGLGFLLSRRFEEYV